MKHDVFRRRTMSKTKKTYNADFKSRVVLEHSGFDN